MTQKELARLLGVSPGMVSRHVKQGMPIDTVERAEKWRKRHLEPGRVKGSRYDSKAKPTPPATPQKVPDFEDRVCLLNKALQVGPVAPGDPVLAEVRTALRALPNWKTAADTLEMPVRVWVRLMAGVCSVDALACARALVQDSKVTAAQLADAIHDGYAPEWAAGGLLEAAWDIYELDGKAFPDEEDDDGGE